MNEINPNSVRTDELLNLYYSTKECLDYYESLRITADRRDFHKVLISQTKNFLIVVNQNEYSHLLNTKIFDKSFGDNNLKNINDYIYYLYKTLFIIFVDEFALDKAYESYKNLIIAINNSSFAQNKEESMTLNEPLFDFTKRLYLIGKFTEAKEIFADFEKRYFFAKSFGFGYDTYYCELKEILGGTRVTYFVINHQVQLDNLKRLGRLSEKREKQANKRFQKAKNARLKCGEILNSFLEYSGFIPKTPYENNQHINSKLKYIPEPPSMEYYYENLSNDQKYEYSLAYTNNTNLNLVIKYQHIRIGCLLRTIIHHPDYLKYEDVITECQFFSSIILRRNSYQYESSMQVIKFCNYLSSLFTNERIEVLNCLKLLHNNFESMMGLPIDRNIDIPPFLKGSKLLNSNRTSTEYIPEKGNWLYHKFCIIPQWTYIENAMLPIERLKSYLNSW